MYAGPDRITRVRPPDVSVDFTIELYERYEEEERIKNVEDGRGKIRLSRKLNRN